MSIAPGPVTFASREAEDEYWMGLALNEARIAAEKGEVPVGAVLLVSGAAVAKAYNAMVATRDATQHAELRVIKAGAYAAGEARMGQATLYVTLEPCAMCAGALIQARVPLLVYGAPDERAGAVDSHFHICDSDHLNHRVEVIRGVLEAECRALMQGFFKGRRQK